MATLTVTHTESITLDAGSGAETRGSTNALAITGINEIYERTVTCVTGQTTTIASFGTHAHSAANNIDTADVRYVRVTNLSLSGAPKTLELGIGLGATAYAVTLKFGESHVLGSASTLGLATDANNTPPVTGTITDLTSITVRNDSGTDTPVELFIAAV